jgi:hypothetical protein
MRHDADDLRSSWKLTPTVEANISTLLEKGWSTPDKQLRYSCYMCCLQLRVLKC